MKRAPYVLRVESGGWTHRPHSAHDPGYRLLNFTFVAASNGRWIGGNNVQAVVGARDRSPTDWTETSWSGCRRAGGSACATTSHVYRAWPRRDTQLGAGASRCGRSDRIAHVASHRGAGIGAFAAEYHAEGPAYWS